jgi:cell wall assembly regulator SMI1
VFAGLVQVSPRLDKGSTIEFTIQIDGAKMCHASYTAVDDIAPDTLCNFNLKPGARLINVSGSTIAGKSKHAFNKSWKIHDIANMTALLYAPNRTVAQRIVAFVKANPQAAQYVLLESKSYSAKELDATENKLGHAIPSELREIYRQFGGFKIGDHWLHPPQELLTVNKAMRQVWGTPEKNLDQELSGKSRDLYNRAIMVFTEVGDGMGAVAYEPAPNKSCGNSPNWFYFTQDTINQPDNLFHAGGGCATNEDAIIYLFNRFVIEEHISDAIPETELALDSAAPENRLWLFMSGERRDQVELRRAEPR